MVIWRWIGCSAIYLISDRPLHLSVPANCAQNEQSGENKENTEHHEDKEHEKKEEERKEGVEEVEKLEVTEKKGKINNSSILIL